MRLRGPCCVILGGILRWELEEGAPTTCTNPKLGRRNSKLKVVLWTDGVYLLGLWPSRTMLSASPVRSILGSGMRAPQESDCGGWELVPRSDPGPRRFDSWRCLNIYMSFGALSGSNIREEQNDPLERIWAWTMPGLQSKIDDLPHKKSLNIFDMGTERM